MHRYGTYGGRLAPAARHTARQCSHSVIHGYPGVQPGVEEIAFVVLPGEQQIRGYFTEDENLRDYFHGRQWHHKYRPLEQLHRQARFTFIEQPLDGRYGTAIPAIVARDFVGDSDFFLLSGDDLVLRPDGGCDLADLRRARDEAGVPGGIAVV